MPTPKPAKRGTKLKFVNGPLDGHKMRNYRVLGYPTFIVVDSLNVKKPELSILYSFLKLPDMPNVEYRHYYMISCSPDAMGFHVAEYVGYIGQD